MRVIWATIVSLILSVTMATPALAFNPQPEPPALTNKLNSIINVLVEVEARFDSVVSHPPDPGKSVNGAVGKLGAMAHQLDVVINELFIIDDNIPAGDEAVITAALRVRAGAVAIIDDNLRHPPPDDGRLFAAIGAVVGRARSIVAIIDDNLPVLGGE